MINIKIQISEKQKPIFKMNIGDSYIKKSCFFKRLVIECKHIKGSYNYEVPLRYLVPVINNISKDILKIDKYSELEFLEFFDEYEDKYYASLMATSKFMKLWRKEKCPDIFKVKIDLSTLTISKEIVFRKINIKLK